MVILSYGLGVDSTAILLRWIDEPGSRDFDLSELTVVTAMTGDEWKRTGRDVEAHVLPRMREHGIRYVQVARARRLVTKAGDGVVVLDDSTSPTRLHLDGAFKLSQEMLEVGTVPQSGGARLCSVHAKGDALDPIVAKITVGRPYRHAVGFEAEEGKRSRKDRLHNTPLRSGEYPLQEWGWDRQKCVDYIFGLTGVMWAKSACVYCPFALTKGGRAATIERYRNEDPEASTLTLLMERVSMALNPAQGLLAGAPLIDELAGHGDILDRFQAALGNTDHALYEVRRIIWPAPRRPDRWIARHLVGSPALMAAALEEVGSPTVGDDGIARVYLKDRGVTAPGLEHFYVVAPATAANKSRPQFERWWDELQPDHPNLSHPASSRRN